MTRSAIRTGPAGVMTVLLLMAQSATVQHAAAQQPSEVLTLDEAIRIARAQNPAYQRTANDLNVAADAVRSAWGAFLPTLSTSLSFSGSRSRRVTGEDDFGGVIERPEAKTFQSSSASQGISTGMTLFNGALLPGLRAERAQYERATAQVRGAAIQLDAQVSRAFFTAVQATQNIALEEQLLASARERLEHTEQLVALAARTRVDMLGAQEEVLTYEQSLQRARGEADKARLALAVLLGLQPETPLTLETVVPPVFDPAELNVEQLVSAAVANSPAVLQQVAALSAAGHRRSAAGAGRWPTVSVSAGYSRSAGAQDFGAFGQFDLPNSGMSFSTSISLPLFTRFQRSAAVSTAAAAEEDAAHELRAAQLTVERDVRSGVIDLANAYRALQIAEQRADISRERLELALQQYQSGGSTFTELQNVIDRTAQAERQALDARFSFYTSRVALEETLGSRLER